MKLLFPIDLTLFDYIFSINIYYIAKVFWDCGTMELSIFITEAANKTNTSEFISF